MPTEDVIATPVKSTTGFEAIDNEPTADVAPSPVNPITSAGAKAPVEEVIDKPVGLTITLKSTLTDPTVEVALCPVGVNVRSDIAVGVPTEEVVESPVKPSTLATSK